MRYLDSTNLLLSQSIRIGPDDIVKSKHGNIPGGAGGTVRISRIDNEKNVFYRSRMPRSRR